MRNRRTRARHATFQVQTANNGEVKMARAFVLGRIVRELTNVAC